MAFDLFWSYFMSCSGNYVESNWYTKYIKLDPLSTPLLKTTFHASIQTLTHLINISFKSGIVTRELVKYVRYLLLKTMLCIETRWNITVQFPSLPFVYKYLEKIVARRLCSTSKWRLPLLEATIGIRTPTQHCNYESAARYYLLHAKLQVWQSGSSGFISSLWHYELCYPTTDYAILPKWISSAVCAWFD